MRMGHAMTLAALLPVPMAMAQVSAPAVAESETWPARLRPAISRCWNVAGLSPEARAGSVTLSVRFDEAARPLPDSFRRVGYERMSEPAAQEAYEAARRAVIRCGTQGYDLPPEKHALWKELHLTFDPGAAGEGGMR